MKIKKTARIILLACLASMAAVSARAELSDVVVLFVKADHNGDRVLSKAEVIATTMLQFNEIDSNQNGLLERREVADYADDAEFLDNDADKSGSLSPEEVITEKLADFKAADTDGDGKLSFTEVKDFYDKQK
jgi:hypothetical protein